VVAISAVELMRVSRGPQIEHFLSQAQNFMSGIDFKPEHISELESSQDEAYCSFTRVRHFHFLFIYISSLYDTSIALLPCHIRIFSSCIFLLAGTKAHKSLRVGTKMALECSRL
jgi:hypothetical protein